MLSTGICRWLFLLVSLATWVTVTSSKEMRVVCYYTNWSVYRPGDGKFGPQNINPYLCTHLIYAFGGFTKENTLKPFDKYQDIEKGGYAKFTGLKTYNKDLKTMLAIGGWNEGSTRFSPMVANPERRKEFAKNAIKFLRLNRFDGLDLDWEYPSFRDGGKPRDKDNYPLLVQELREEFEREAEKTGRPRLLLSMAVPAGIEYINKGFDVPNLTKYLDWLNILSYDFHSAFEPSVNHHAPLYSMEEESEYNFESDLNIDFSIKHYLKNGAEPSKLVLGIPTYGRSYTLFNPDAYEIGSPADGPGTMGEATRENGYLAYYEICDYIKNKDWEVEYPNPKVMGPFSFKDNQWVGYDDEEIIKRKAEYVVENGLGGIMFWSIDNDDFRGNCHGKPYPLIEAGRAALIKAYGLTDDNLIEKPSKPLKSRTRTRTKTLNKIEESGTEKAEKSERPSSSKQRNRIRQNKEKEDEEENISSRRKTRRKNSNKEEETSSYSSLKIVTPSYTTPSPPSTPELDGAFKCEDEGFYPHPKDCKKYFWCLSGAGDSGIIAHQFTCPAGLYFNKAADSCDYTQNVVCKKSSQKTTTTTKKPDGSSTPSSSTTTPTSITFSTRRPPPKITAATSRTTFRQTTTTTEAFEDEEYDDEEEDEEEEDARKNSEEDPKVIKELIELIKKAGGIEELEKQLKLKGNSSNSEQATTKSPLFSKSLYERVLSKAIKNTSNDRNSSFRNSRGPQSLKTESDEKPESHSKSERGKLQYTSISRFRPSTKKTEKEKEPDQLFEQNIENQSTKTVTEKYPSYTNIRRARVSTTTSDPENYRSKILGEKDEEENEDDNDDEETEDDELHTTKRNYVPQYVNIRRQRPSTTEESSTSKYVDLRRGTTENSTNEEDIHTTSKYKILRRGTTTTIKPKSDELSSSSTASSSEETTSTSDNALRSSVADDSRNSTTEKNRNEYVPNVITTTGTYVTTTDDINLIKSEINESKSTETQNVSSKPNLINHFQRKRPQLFEPRPFTKPTEATTARPRTQTTKVSESSYNSETGKISKEKANVNFRSRGSSRFNPNRKVNTEDIEKQPISSRRRIVVTEKYIEENRTYRPSEIADLSSLTAVDFDNIKGLNSRNNFRRRRPLKPTITTENDIQTTSNAPLRRRIHLDQKISTSEETKRTEEYKTTPIYESSNLSTLRNRKVIRRFRTSTLAPDALISLEQNNQRNRTALKPLKSILDAPQKTNEVDDDSFEDSTTEEEENIKLSESNIRENNDFNIFKPDPKLQRKLNKPEIYGKSSIIDKNLGRQSPEDATITSVEPSSSSSTESSVPNRTRKIIRRIQHTQSTKVPDKEVDAEQFFGRKRKIIRKLRPISNFSLNSTTSVPFSQDKLNDEVSERNPELEDDIKDNEQTKKIYRPKLTNRRTTSTSTTVEPDITSKRTRNKTVLLRGPNRGYRPKFNLTSLEVSSEPSVALEKFSPRYNYISRSRSTKSTITTQSTTEIGSENLLTMDSQDETDYTTTENTVPTNIYSVTQKETKYETTTENNLPETTTQFISTQENIVNSDINTKYAIDSSTTLLFKTTTELTTAGEEYISTINTEQTTEENEDTTTYIPKTTLPATSSTSNEDRYNILSSSTIRTIGSRPKFNLYKPKDPSTTELSVNGLKPKLNYRNRFQSSTSEKAFVEPEVNSKSIGKDNNRFNRYRQGFRTSEKPKNDSVDSSSVAPINKSLYKYRKPKPQVINNDREIEFVDEDDDDKNEEASEKPKSRYLFNINSRTTRPTNKPYFNKPSSKTPNFTKTTTEESINEELKDINTDAVKNRNKSLFKNRKLNLNLFSPSTSPSTVSVEESTAYEETYNTDSSTLSPTSEHTEHPTTFIHVFAQKETPTTEGFNPVNQSTTSKVERIIEVNRIVNVKTKEDVIKHHHLEHGKDKESSPLYDKIGAVNRVTVIKVVDKDGHLVNNETSLSPVYVSDSETESPIKSSVDMIIQIAKIQELPPPDSKVNLTKVNLDIKEPGNREERKFDFITRGKVDDSKVRNIGKAEIIEGLSHINVITPRPIYLTEASTIALEALFQSEKPTLFTSKNSINEELLETENSKFVNVRILHPDEEVRLNKELKETKVIPIKLLRQDDEEYFTMRAKVVEVSPKSSFNTIKIVPIKVEAVKKMPPPLPLIRINRDHN